MQVSQASATARKRLSDLLQQRHPMPIRQYVTFFGTHTPWFGICAGIALLAIGIWMIVSFRTLGIEERRQNEILFGFPFMVLFGILTAFVLDAFFTGDWKTWTSQSERRFGFTYTGWMLGCMAFVMVYGRFTSFGSLYLLNFFLPAFALSQAIGRLGCFLGGCCYGVPCKFGFAYPQGSIPHERFAHLPLFPVQLMESLFLALLFVLCTQTRFDRRAAKYLIGVAVIRFVCDFVRGDNRGDILGFDGLSPQQVVSIFIFSAGLIIHYIQCKTECRPGSCVA